ncbi:hypothetical protein KM043_016131 [Ampulex compressa]|nr:hypothetical protein KM043_016131 [Ampulex compressa]
MHKSALVRGCAEKRRRRASHETLEYLSLRPGAVECRGAEGRAQPQGLHNRRPSQLQPSFHFDAVVLGRKKREGGLDRRKERMDNPTLSGRVHTLIWTRC